MLPEDIKTWVQLALALPAIIGAYKLPSGYRWMKTKITTAIATAMLSQLMPQLDAIQRSLAEVRHQVFPNGGGSMNDNLGRVLASAERTERNVRVLQATTRAHQDADLNQARFEADSAGKISWISYAFLQWVGRGLEQVLQHGWTNSICMADRERVRTELRSAIGEQREFICNFSLVDTTGRTIPVAAFAKPIRCDGNAETEHWVGVITRVVVPIA